MKLDYKIVAWALLFGIFVWFADAAIDSFWFYEGTFLDQLLFDVPPIEIYMRTLILASFIVFGFIL